MSRFDIYRKHGFRKCSCKTTSDELKTRQGLAITPTDVARLTSQGLPVNNENARMFYDGDINPSPYVTSERRRGVDVAELWEEHQKIVAKCRNLHTHAKKSVKPKKDA